MFSSFFYNQLTLCKKSATGLVELPLKNYNLLMLILLFDNNTGFLNFETSCKDDNPVIVCFF